MGMGYGFVYEWLTKRSHFCMCWRAMSGKWLVEFFHLIDMVDACLVGTGGEGPSDAL